MEWYHVVIIHDWKDHYVVQASDMADAVEKTFAFAGEDNNMTLYQVTKIAESVKFIACAF